VGTIRVFNHHIHSTYYWLALIEAGLFFLAFYLGAYFYFYQEGELLELHMSSTSTRALIFAGVSVAAMGAMGLYKPHLREGSSGVLLRLIGAFGLTILAMSVIYYLLPNLYVWRGVFAQTVVAAFVIALISRRIFAAIVDSDQLKSRVLVLGAGVRAHTIVNSMRRASDRRGFKFVGFVNIEGQPVKVDTEQVVQPGDCLVEYVKTQNIDRILVALDDRRNSIDMDQLVQCKFMGVEVIDAAGFFEREMGKIMLDFVTPGWFAFADGFNASTWSLASKRIFDIAASFLLLMVTWPIMLVTIIAIWLEDGFAAPVVYRQERVGKNGETFQVLKLRSMRVNAEKDGQAVWAAVNDSRITRVGSFIRRTRIDELPQIINILAGDMALVGPRPERPEFVTDLESKIPYYEARHQVKPGIAGWAQLRYPYGASDEDARQKLQFDLYYVKNNSLFLDFMILLTTVEVVLFGQGVR
jgi:sugar transferase (PEP-CTERM system associated)